MNTIDFSPFKFCEKTNTYWLITKDGKIIDLDPLSGGNGLIPPDDGTFEKYLIIDDGLSWKIESHWFTKGNGIVRNIYQGTIPSRFFFVELMRNSLFGPGDLVH